MLFALVNGVKTFATPNQRGKCPVCDGVVTSVCSPKQYKINHWRHLSSTNCDPWKRGETQWHLNWKNLFPKEYCEIVMRDELTNEKHKADIRIGNGLIIEFQNSPLSQTELDCRIKFYKKMIWVVNGSNFGVQHEFVTSLKPRSYGSDIAHFMYWGFSKFFSKWSSVPVPVFLDFGTHHLFWLKKFDERFRNGTVQIVTKKEFLNKYAMK